MKRLPKCKLPDAIIKHLAGMRAWLVVSSADDEEVLGPYLSYSAAVAAAKILPGTVFACTLRVARE
jgi:hypothetical protein